MAKAPLQAEMFNRKASSQKSGPDEILRVLDIKAGQKVADIGSGGGYFTLRFARAVGNLGKVYAADTNKEFLDYIGSSAQEKGLGNVTAIHIARDLEFPEKLDLIFMRNLYHHLTDRTAYFKRLAEFLKPGGKLVIIEYKPNAGGKLSFHRLFGHSTPKETIIAEVEAAGYRTVKEKHFLPEQNFLIFSLEK